MLEVGKLDSDLLKKIVFRKIKYKRPEVITRPGIGEDCAVIDFGEYECVMSTDPITAASSEIGRLAVHISCNDIASNGVEPLGIMLAVMLPVGTTAEDVELIMSQAAEVSEKLGVEIIGGHTEITPAVAKPVIVSTAIGRALAGHADKVRKLRPGDGIYITKMVGIEGAAIIAKDKGGELSAVLTKEELAEAKSFVESISVVAEGIIAGKLGICNMHDITEGGVLGAVWEMCNIDDVGAMIDIELVPVAEVTKKIAKHYGIDYLRLISSGCMLIIASPEKKLALEEKMKEAAIKITKIGEIKPEEFGVKQVLKGEITDIAPPKSDELYKVVK